MTGDGIPSFESPLAGLVVASADGGFASDGFTRIDADLRADQLDSDDHFLLPLLEPAFRRHVPDWRFLPIAAGLRRRARLEAAMAAQLAAAARAQLLNRGVDAVLVGDLAAARILHGQLLGPGATDDQIGIRRASLARLLIPRGTSGKRVGEALRSTAEQAGATVLDRPKSGLSLHGVEVRVSKYAGIAFAFPSAQESVWRSVQRDSSSSQPGDHELPTPSAEYLMFESIASSSLGPPRIRWLVDAVGARRRALGLDWSEVVAIAQEHRWSTPVHRAMRSLAELGFDIPESALVAGRSGESAMDRALQRRLGAAGRRRRAALASLVAARSIRNWLV